MRRYQHLIVCALLLFVSGMAYSQTQHSNSFKGQPQMPGNISLDPSPCFSMDRNIIEVPDDHKTIQSAIKAAKDGDFVIVDPGTYFENINFMGKLIKVISRHGPQFTTIDGGDTGDPDAASTVTFNGGETSFATISGFTITNGMGTESLPLGYYCGGGIFCLQSSPTIANNWIVYNQAGQPPPGGMIHSNIGMGGGIACYLSEAQIINNLIAYNVSESKGGALACRQSKIRMVNNTVTENISRAGGSIYASDLSRVTIVDSIFWENEAHQGREWSIRSYCTFVVSYTDLQGSMAAIELGPNSFINWGDGVIDSDPLFVFGPEGDYYLNNSVANPSPCVDTGSSYALYLKYNTCWTCSDETPDSGIVDMGYHYGPHAPFLP